MSAIYLVRHGQASFGRSDYDKLSELGEQQARIAGTALADRGVNPALLVCGTLQRQRVTASRMWEAAGWEAEVEIDEGWNELDHEDLIAVHKPAYRNRAVMLADLARHGNPRKAYQAMYVEACKQWLAGNEDDDFAESFQQFSDRIALALGRVTSRLVKGQDAVVVTSGGPMSWIAASLLTAVDAGEEGESLSLPSRFPDGAQAAWLRLSRVTVNTGITTVLQGRSLNVLDVNVHTHLAGAEELITYR